MPLPAGPSELLQALPRTRRKTPTPNTQFPKNTSRPRAAFLYSLECSDFFTSNSCVAFTLPPRPALYSQIELFVYRSFPTETYIAPFTLKAQTPRHNKLSVYFINCSFTASTFPANFVSAE